MLGSRERLTAAFLGRAQFSGGRAAVVFSRSHSYIFHVVRTKGSVATSRIESSFCRFGHWVLVPGTGIDSYDLSQSDLILGLKFAMCTPTRGSCDCDDDVGCRIPGNVKENNIEYFVNCIV